MFKHKLLPLASLLGLGLLPSAHAADQFQDNRWYAAPFASYVQTGGDRKVDDGWGGGLGIGKIIDQHFNVELRGFYQDFGGKNGLLSLTGGTVDVQYYFARDKFSPYTVAGVGGINSCLGGNCAGGFIGELGLGFTYELHDNFLLRSDVRYRYNDNLGSRIQPGIDEFHDMVVNVGFVIPFGDKPKAAAPIEAPAPVAPAPRPAAPAPADCSTLDSDHDGVNNCLDKCPDTPKGSKVDFNGCPIKLILKGSQFKYNSAELTQEAKTILDEVAASLISYPQKNDIEVQGHTSSEGSDSYNMKLSQKRAKSVVDYLKLKHVSNKLTAKGFGEAKPVADNRTEAGRSENRRVELIWITD